MDCNSAGSVARAASGVRLAGLWWTMASKLVDPLQTLQAALSVPANSKEQADLLAALRESLEIQPAPISILVGTLLTIVVNAGDSLLKRWVIDLLQFAICRSTLTLEQKTQS